MDIATHERARGWEYAGSNENPKHERLLNHSPSLGASRKQEKKRIFFGVLSKEDFSGFFQSHYRNKFIVLKCAASP